MPLPISKSISNRALIINALSQNKQNSIESLAICDDVDSMQRVLNSSSNVHDIGHAGTAMRFLTAYFTIQKGQTNIITGSKRMKQRPIAVLVDSLKELGAEIEYLENPGFPPLKIKGKELLGGKLQIDSAISSQYISAIMMIAPYMQKGLTLELQGKVVSRTYIFMTHQIMQAYGAKISINKNIINIQPQAYISSQYRVEGDWSAASYYYEILAIKGRGTHKLNGLYLPSVQGDSLQTSVWEQLGVTTEIDNKNGIIISAHSCSVKHLDYDFVDMPDLVQSFVVACCLKNITFRFSGVETLRIKETDRISALINELSKLGYILQAEGDKVIVWDGKKQEAQKNIKIATYNDHRMAMAFAPAALFFKDLTILNPEVVSKSFPDYWKELEQIL